MDQLLGSRPLRFDKNRKGKKVSNEEWESSTDPDSRIPANQNVLLHCPFRVGFAALLPAGQGLAVEELDPAGLLGRNRSKRHLVNVNAFLRTHKQCARIGNA